MCILFVDCLCVKKKEVILKKQSIIFQIYSISNKKKEITKNKKLKKGKKKKYVLVKFIFKI